MSEWMPIETAPKDETSVDLWISFINDVASGAYRLPDCWWCPDHQAWIRLNGWDGEPTIVVGEPTHWRPLPEPPIQTESANL